MVREVAADIAQSRRPQQRIAERVEQHVAIGVSDQTASVRDAHTAQGDELTRTKGVNVEPVTDAHDGVPCGFNDRRFGASDRTRPAPDLPVG